MKIHVFVVSFFSGNHFITSKLFSFIRGFILAIKINLFDTFVKIASVPILVDSNKSRHEFGTFQKTL